MKLFRQVIFHRLRRFIISSIRIYIGFNGLACICLTFAHLKKLFHSSYQSFEIKFYIYRNILQIFVANIQVLFRRQIDWEKFTLNGIFFKQVAIQVYMCQFCVSLERKVLL